MTEFSPDMIQTLTDLFIASGGEAGRFYFVARFAQGWAWRGGSSGEAARGATAAPGRLWAPVAGGPPKAVDVRTGLTDGTSTGTLLAR